MPGAGGGEDMPIRGQAILLRAFLGEDDRHKGRPLYETIVERARAEGLAGATVLRGAIGFGHSAVIRTSRTLALSEDLPIVVEIVDREERIDAFLPCLDEIMTGGLITLEKVRVIRYAAAPRG
jgi:PII-like signaling protein